MKFMQYMVLFTRNPDKAIPPDLGAAEFEAVRDLYADGLIRQIWLRGDVGGACAIVEGSSDVEVSRRVNALPLVHAGILQPPMIVALKPYAGFGPRS
ncbi:MAG: hypothetical protein JO283_16285 [Bradyrhizobium sp.]|nr:hypothetical protein [Bradyrhizobium sp.]